MNDTKIIGENCPNPSCQRAQSDFVHKINTLLFGTDENSGWAKKLKDLEICIRARVTKTWLIGTAITLIGVLVVVFVPMVSGAIKTIREVSDTNIQLQERVTHSKEKLDNLEVKNINEHKAFIELHKVDITAIKQELNLLLTQSEDRIKEHIDLSIRAYIRETNGAGKKTGP